jgi:hypothetical protein
LWGTTRVSPRVVQSLMRHSTLELTGRYTRPRAVDIDRASRMLPRLTADPLEPDSTAATGTDGRHINEKLSLPLPYFYCNRFEDLITA